MCSDPQTLPNGVVVACRRCRICNDNVTKDWTGRCLAESRTSVATMSVTLTYGRDKNGVDRHERAAVLTYSDIQLWLKRLRNNGYPVRYLISGEYGKRKGRSHWHGIMFFQKEALPVKKYTRFWDDLWTHGHQVWKDPTPKHVAYCCKYIRKDIKDANAQSKFEVSKVPPIGGHYFVSKAVEMVKQGIVPHDRLYTFPEAKLKNGKPVQFYLHGKTFDLFMNTYVKAYRIRHGDKVHLPNSDMLDEWMDKQEPYVGAVDCWPRLPKTLEEVKEIKEAQAKIDYRAKHNEYFFGKNMMGLYETDWIPDGEEEQEVTGF